MYYLYNRYINTCDNDDYFYFRYTYNDLLLLSSLHNCYYQIKGLNVTTAIKFKYLNINYHYSISLGPLRRELQLLLVSKLNILLLMQLTLIMAILIMLIIIVIIITIIIIGPLRRELITY